MTYLSGFYSNYLDNKIVDQQLLAELKECSVLKLDSQLNLTPEITKDKVVIFDNFNEELLEEVCLEYGQNIQYMEILNSKKVANFDFLKNCPNLKMLTIMWNQKNTCLWEGAYTPKLQHLSLFNFTKLTDLTPLIKFAELKTLTMDFRFDGQWFVDSYAPFVEMPSLENLILYRTRPRSDGYYPLTNLTKLKLCYLDTSSFPTAEFAYLAAYHSVTTTNFQHAYTPFVEATELEKALEKSTTEIMLFPVGKGQRAVSLKGTEKPATLKKKITKLYEMEQAYQDIKNTKGEN